MASRNYTDPRARRLVAHAWLALSMAGLLVLMLAAMLLGSAGLWGWLEWTVTTVIGMLAAIAEGCAWAARHVEARALADWSAPRPAGRARARTGQGRPVPAARLGGVTRVEVDVPVRVRPELLPRRTPAPAAAPTPTEPAPASQPAPEQVVTAGHEGGLR
jgi:hypothetical protein